MCRQLPCPARKDNALCDIKSGAPSYYKIGAGIVDTTVASDYCKRRLSLWIYIGLGWCQLGLRKGASAVGSVYFKVAIWRRLFQVLRRLGANLHEASS